MLKTYIKSSNYKLYKIQKIPLKITAYSKHRTFSRYFGYGDSHLEALCELGLQSVLVSFMGKQLGLDNKT